MSKLNPTFQELEDEVDFYRDRLREIAELEEEKDYEDQVSLLDSAIDIAKRALKKHAF